MRRTLPILMLGWMLGACGGSGAPVMSPESGPPAAHQPPGGEQAKPMTAGTFGDDLAFLKSHTDVIVLEDGGAKVAVSAEYQGRVLTSSAGGDAGASFGFINREVIAGKKRQPHINVFGGEDRFWLGPEGGQFALYFPKGAPFEFDHWQVPDAIDWGAWAVASQSATQVVFRKDMALTNHSGTSFSVKVERTVSLLPAKDVGARLGGSVPAGVSVVAYESSNVITNAGTAPWKKETGLLSVWILGMYQPSARTTIVLPFREGPEAQLGPVVKDDYFGKVPAARLKAGKGVLFFRGDGLERGKIGIPRPRALPIAGSYDAAQGVLTLVEYTLPDDPGAGYVNSEWKQQDAPYGGDVVNSYNDGSPGPGKKPLGPFYEIETSSPGAALAPGQSLTHVHRTMHLVGPRESLDAIAKSKLGVGITEIEAAFAVP